MEIAVKTQFMGLKPKIGSYKQSVAFCVPSLSCKRVCFSSHTGYNARGIWRRASHAHKCCSAVGVVLSGVEDFEVLPSQFGDFIVTSTGTNKARELKISIEVLGMKTRAIFDDVFDKMVAAAQPIPGFRRVKGGKTPDIPRDILLEILGPSKVYKQVIKKVINSIVAEYVEKENLKVSTDLRVEQSYEDLEDTFEPGENFSFDAVIQLQETS
ncbi:Trigger_N domain-containing protein, partial [Cephalotus follicularis]